MADAACPYRRTLRGWTYASVLSLGLLAFCVVGLLMALSFADETGNDAVDLPGRIGGAVIFVGCIVLLARLPFLRVVLTDDGVVLHSLVRNRRFTWKQIEGCEVSEISGTYVPLVAPTLTLADSGECLGIRVLESFALFRKPERTRAGRLAAAIEAKRVAAAN